MLHLDNCSNIFALKNNLTCGVFEGPCGSHPRETSHCFMNTAPVVFSLSVFWWAQAGGVKSRTKGRLLTCLIWSPSVSRTPIKPALCVQPGLRSHVASGRRQHRAPHILRGPMNQSEPAEEYKVKYPSSMVSLLWIKTLIWVTLQMFISRKIRSGSICWLNITLER